MSFDVFIRCECGKLVHSESTDEKKLVMDIDHECGMRDECPDDFSYLPLLIAGVVVLEMVVALGTFIGVMKGG